MSAFEKDFCGEHTWRIQNSNSFVLEHRWVVESSNDRRVNDASIGFVSVSFFLTVFRCVIDDW